MNPFPASFPKPLEEIEKLIKGDKGRYYYHRPIYSIGEFRASLKPIRDALNLEHERHGEILEGKEDKIWALQNQLQAERTEKDQLQREIKKVKAEKEVLLRKVDRVSQLEKEIRELKEKGKRAASALMSTAKELEEEGPPSK